MAQALSRADMLKQTVPRECLSGLFFFTEKKKERRGIPTSLSFRLSAVMRVVVITAVAAKTTKTTAAEEKNDDNDDDPPAAESATTVIVPAHKKDLL